MGVGPALAAPADRFADSIVGSVLAWVAQIGDYLGFRGIDPEQGQTVGLVGEGTPEASTDECGITVEPGG